jgi:hypothetical protein
VGLDSSSGREIIKQNFSNRNNKILVASQPSMNLKFSETLVDQLIKFWCYGCAHFSFWSVFFEDLLPDFHSIPPVVDDWELQQSLSKLLQPGSSSSNSWPMLLW